MSHPTQTQISEEEDLLVKHADEFARAAVLRPMQEHEIQAFVYMWLHYTSKENMSKQEAIDWIQGKVADCDCWVADCQGLLLSFLVTQGDTIVFAYTLKPFKRKGLCKRLITHATGRYLPVVARVCPKKKQIARMFSYDDSLQKYVKRS